MWNYTNLDEFLSKEAKTFEGSDMLKNSKAFQKFVLEFGGINDKANYPLFLQTVVTFMENQVITARSAYNKTIEEIQNIIVPETIDDCKMAALDILVNKQDKIQKVNAFIDSQQTVFQNEFNKIVSEEQSQQRTQI